MKLQLSLPSITAEELNLIVAEFPDVIFSVENASIFDAARIYKYLHTACTEENKPFHQATTMKSLAIIALFASLNLALGHPPTPTPIGLECLLACPCDRDDCLFLDDPVCGRNGVTYVSECHLVRANFCDGEPVVRFSFVLAF